MKDLKYDSTWKEINRKKRVRQHGYRISNAQMMVLLLSWLCCLFKGMWIIPVALWGYYISYFIFSGYKDKTEEIVTEENLRNGMGGELYLQQAREVLGPQKADAIIKEKLADARKRFYQYDWTAYNDILNFTSPPNPDGMKALMRWMQMEYFQKYLDLVGINFMQLYPSYRRKYPGWSYEQLKKYWESDVVWVRRAIYTAVEKRLLMYVYGETYLSKEQMQKHIETGNNLTKNYRVPVGDFIRDNIYNDII